MRDALHRHTLHIQCQSQRCLRTATNLNRFLNFIFDDNDDNVMTRFPLRFPVRVKGARVDCSVGINYIR